MDTDKLLEEINHEANGCLQILFGAKVETAIELAVTQEREACAQEIASERPHADSGCQCAECRRIWHLVGKIRARRQEPSP